MSNQTLIDALVSLSRHYGKDEEFVLAGGGNTSVKTEDRLFVKASGHALATIGPDGFVEMDRAKLTAILSQDLGVAVQVREQKFKEAAFAARVHPEKNQRPSVECVMHNLLPARFVVHSHATRVNMLTCCKSGQKLARELLGDDMMWVPCVDPGVILARTMADLLKKYQNQTGRAFPVAVLMENHGLIICGDSEDEVHRNTAMVLEKVSAKLGAADAPFGVVAALPADQAKALVNIVGPALRGLLAEGSSLKIVAFDDSPTAMSLVAAAEGQAVATAGPLTPDQIVYCKSFPMWIELDPAGKPAEIVAKLRSAIADHVQRTGSTPLVVLVKGVGLFAIGEDLPGATTVKAVYLDAIKVMAGARQLGGIQYLAEAQRQFIEQWEAEAYRRGIAAAAGAAAGRVVGKIALVTGAAQGFGLEIATDLAAQGAYVVLTDINVEGSRKAADGINQRCGKTRAIGLAINVTDGASVAEAVHQTVRAFGGIDILVSNAGVLKAESVKTQSDRDFDFVTAVNYKGYFVMVQKTSPIMATQHLARPDAWFDIIQINSKSGLVGSNRNSAYAGSKFGGIGLTQSFALELVEDGIKVNSICPGNFFDGPLWSDPNTGLFVQYLRTGKVPGAKTIADVKKAYELKVPMGRGCTTPDVMNAIYYLVDQKYETGQAVPVTGGQVMLS